MEKTTNVSELHLTAHFQSFSLLSKSQEKGKTKLVKSDLCSVRRALKPLLQKTFSMQDCVSCWLHFSETTDPAFVHLDRPMIGWLHGGVKVAKHSYLHSASLSE